MSPETAVACAIAGKFSDPRSLKMTMPKIAVPKKYAINDNLILHAAKPKAKEHVYHGPNIMVPPVIKAPGDTIKAPVLLKVEDKITTDHIMPAGSRLKYRSNVEAYAEYVFESVDTTFPTRAKQAKQSIVVAGKSYGQGSSREHAALCPAYLGVKAILAQSIERIHRANLINYGILPLTFVKDSDYKNVTQGVTLEVQGVKKALAEIKKSDAPAVVNIKNMKTKKTFDATLEISGREADIIAAGGRLNYVKKSLKK